MTNSDALDDLDLIHSAINDLQELMLNEETQARYFLSYLELIEKRFDPLHEYLHRKLKSKEAKK